MKDIPFFFLVEHLLNEMNLKLADGALIVFV